MAKGWSHQKILFSIRERGSTLAALSREAGYGQRTLHSALYKRHPRAHAVIARFLGVSRHELWPHWYGPSNELLPLTPVVKTRARRVGKAAPK
ncbi:helix-turn-helix domain-containing protein [Methylosinus sp. Sm6]|uniref:helix-turn-helix domain-containing protein n=1 Tax=Methylosinus sp. Sm6 TaxID=2866948 RepID=UPI001C990F4A|nr:helix-turn-helix domain-containing protein [Methylosinus sp. Sm6]MBY6244010.1 helix-turn-helix domain-containing protein [Methylosinus sp. Sm6]